MLFSNDLTGLKILIIRPFRVEREVVVPNEPAQPERSSRIESRLNSVLPG